MTPAVPCASSSITLCTLCPSYSYTVCIFLPSNRRASFRPVHPAHLGLLHPLHVLTQETLRRLPTRSRVNRSFSRSPSHAAWIGRLPLSESSASSWTVAQHLWVPASAGGHRRSRDGFVAPEHKSPSSPDFPGPEVSPCSVHHQRSKSLLQGEATNLVLCMRSRVLPAAEIKPCSAWDQADGCHTFFFLIVVKYT